MIGKRIKDLRDKKGVTQEDLANYLGIVPQTVYKYEKEINEPDLKTTSKIAEYFNVTTDYLIGINKEQKDTIDLSDLSEIDKSVVLRIVELAKNNNKS